MSLPCAEQRARVHRAQRERAAGAFGGTRPNRQTDSLRQTETHPPCSVTAAALANRLRSPASCGGLPESVGPDASAGLENLRLPGETPQPGPAQTIHSFTLPPLAERPS